VLPKYAQRSSKTLQNYLFVATHIY
jgi:hypothetical protein